MKAEAVIVRAFQHVESSLRQMLSCWRSVENNRSMTRQSAQKVEDAVILAPRKKGVIPPVDQFTRGDCLDVRKVHNHALARIARGRAHLTGQGDFDGIAVPVQMTAPAVVIGNTMARVELEPACDAHERPERSTPDYRAESSQPQPSCAATSSG
jgi:hypothetical protein